MRQGIITLSLTFASLFVVVAALAGVVLTNAACASDEHRPPTRTADKTAPSTAAPAPKTTAPPPATTTAAAAQQCPREQTVHFDFNDAGLRSDAQSELSALASCFQHEASAPTLLIEGHTDERGTTEYNLALGERRAHSIEDYLARLGVPKTRVKTVSYGKERPVDKSSTEEAWAKNRRGEIVLQP